jgi:hypothetical protein
MCRPSREFRAESFELEGRLLLAVGHASIPVTELVHFESNTSPGATPPTQVVTQQVGEATVTLSRSNTAGSLQVQVTTDPSPAVGVNVGAVDQTVTFANGQRRTAVTVPILAGAPNPGEVHVSLSIRPIDHSPMVVSQRDHNAWAPLKLIVLASDPPKIASEQESPRSIVLTFSKPMNPVGASNVNNYSVSLVNDNAGGIRGGGLGAIFGWHSGASVSSKPVPLQSAQYDPATQTVTLVPKQRLPRLDDVGYINVTQVYPAKTSVQPGHPLNVAQGLTDLQGDPIDVDSPTPGKVAFDLTYNTGGDDIGGLIGAFH